MILALNTSTPQMGIAMMHKDGWSLANMVLSQGPSHFGSLMSAVHFLLENMGSDMHQIEGVAVAVGPGSFTGLRVGVATAKGFAHALGIPLMGISSLKALAVSAGKLDNSIIIAPLLDSRRDEVFTAPFLNENNDLLQTAEEHSVRFDSLSDIYDPLRTLFIGSNPSVQIPRLSEIYPNGFMTAPAHLWSADAVTVGFLGLFRFLSKDYDDLQTLTPVYLRDPDIRPNPYASFFKARM